MSGTVSDSDDGGQNEAANTVAAISDEATVRDRVWDATLDLIKRRPIPFQAWRVRTRAGLDRSHDRTIRRTLTVMADAGWLDHE
ncbi:MAG: hypothetical protein ACOCY1_05915, partial [Halovenus sp.]